MGADMVLDHLGTAGIPPAAGFIAKVTVFAAAIRAGHWPLVLIAVLSSVVAAFFYIRVIVLMYMQEPEDATPVDAGLVGYASSKAGLDRAVVAATAVITLVFGFFPGPVLRLLESASVIRF